MKDYGDLLNRFDSINDLSVSEELLGAYFEGNLNELEVANINSDLRTNTQLSEFMESIQNIETDIQYEEFNLIPIEGLELPNIEIIETNLCPSPNDILFDSSIIKEDNDEYFSYQETNDNHIDCFSESDMLNEDLDNNSIQNIDECFNNLNF